MIWIRIIACVALVFGWAWPLTGEGAELPLSGVTGGEQSVGGNCEEWNTREFFESATSASIAACLEAGADVNQMDNQRLAPLHFAVRYDNQEAVIALLDAGADADIGKSDTFTPLHLVRSVAVARVLLAANADVAARTKFDRRTPLHHAALMNGNPEVLAALIGAGADPEARTAGGRTLLHLVAGHNESVEVLRYVLDAGGNPKAEWGEDRWTPLHSAAWGNGNPEVLAALIGAGADPEARTANGRTVLHLAAETNESAAIIESLLATDADVDDRNERGETALHRASFNPNPAVVKALLTAGSDVSARDKYGYAALHRAVARSSNVEVVEALLAFGSDPNGRVANSLTPLHELSSRYIHQPSDSEHTSRRFREESPRIVTALVAAGAAPNLESEGGSTPLSYAVEHLGAPVARALMQAGAKIGPGGVLLHAAGNEDPEVLRMLIDGGADIAARGVRTLHRAATFNENTDVIDVLLAAGIDLHARDDSGRSALHHAAAYVRRAPMIRSLVRLGAKLEARDREGNTPLHAAAGWGLDWSPEDHAGDSITALLDLGANPVARNGKGLTPWDLAEENDALKGTDAYWRLNDARFAAPERPNPANHTRSTSATLSAEANNSSPKCEIPGYPSPSNVQALGLPWCGVNVGFQRPVFALQAAGAWCAIATRSSSTTEQVSARHREINSACDSLDAMQSPGTPACQCPGGYRPSGRSQ